MTPAGGSPARDAESSVAGARHECPLCGLAFDEGQAHCGGCPLNDRCGTLCCPRCGYEFVDRSATIDALRGLARRLGGLLAPLRGNTKGRR